MSYIELQEINYHKGEYYFLPDIHEGFGLTIGGVMAICENYANCKFNYKRKDCTRKEGSFKERIC
ncbi:MAG: hypothetical protein XD37_2019 [Thermoanaerobacter thermocopriae]|jgi:hypothetical protein|nr:MAG: hypothetical protein XD37_2019 [Thermoanaerobacter thermocopriae]